MRVRVDGSPTHKTGTSSSNSCTDPPIAATHIATGASTSTGDDDDDSALGSVCQMNNTNTKETNHKTIYKSASSTESVSADSAFRILISFSSFSPLNSHVSLLRLLFLRRFSILIFLSSFFHSILDLHPSWAFSFPWLPHSCSCILESQFPGLLFISTSFSCQRCGRLLLHLPLFFVILLAALANNGDFFLDRFQICFHLLSHIPTCLLLLKGKHLLVTEDQMCTG